MPLWHRIWLHLWLHSNEWLRSTTDQWNSIDNLDFVERFDPLNRRFRRRFRFSLKTDSKGICGQWGLLRRVVSGGSRSPPRLIISIYRDRNPRDIPPFIFFRNNENLMAHTHTYTHTSKQTVTVWKHATETVSNSISKLQFLLIQYNFLIHDNKNKNNEYIYLFLEKREKYIWEIYNIHLHIDWSNFFAT